MKDTDFLFSSCAVKAKENSLLDKAFFEQLIAAPDYEAAISFLIEKGFSGFESTSIPEKALSGYLASFYDEACEYLGEHKDILDFIIIKNDFHNLKAALKLAFSMKEGDGYFISPSLYPAKEIFAAVKELKFELLPASLCECAKNAWEILKNTSDGQRAEFYIDKYALESSNALARKTENDFCIELSNCEMNLQNLKMLLRLSEFSGNEALFADAFLEPSDFDKDSLIKALRGGKSSALDYIAENCDESFSNAAESGMKDFEMLCDDISISVLEKTKFIPFGAEVVIAYFMARIYEYKNLCAVISYKMAGFSAPEIMRRMGKIYE